MIKKIIFWTLFCALVASCSQKTDFNLQIPDGTEMEESPVIKKTAQKNDFYIFEKSQQERIDLFRGMQGSAAVCIKLKVEKTSRKKDGSQNIASLGFLYKNDFKGKTSVGFPLSSRSLINFNFDDFEGQCVEIIYSLERGKECPAGFFVDLTGSKAKYSVVSVQIAQASVGFDYSNDCERYAFAPNGGNLVKGAKKIDFSALAMCFSPVNSEKALMPKICFSFNQNADSVKFTSGGERFTVRNGGSDYLDVPVAALKSPFSELEITENAEQIKSVMAVSSDWNLLENSSDLVFSPVNPIKVDPGLIMQWPQKNWRGNDYELFEWDRFSGILFFDIANYSVQNDFFRRLAFFVEKQGFKGKLLSDAELEGKHGYNAHDYRAYDLARFFEKARAENFPLNKKELLLREILLKNSIIVQNEDGSFSEGRGAVISISQESPLYLRTTFVAHEGWHGIFFVDEDFRNTVSSVFYSLQMADPRAVDFLIKYFQVTPSLNYDTEDEYLLKNEFMAYMLQRPVSACEKYFTDMAARSHSQSFIKEEADYIIETKAAGFSGSAQMLEDYVKRRWNLSAGRVWLLSR